MIEAHLDALIARGASTGLPVHESAVVSAGDAYVEGTYLVWFASSPEGRQERYSEVVGPDSTADFDVDVKVCSTVSARVALKALDRVRSAFQGHRLVVSGRVCSPIVFESGPIRRDPELKPGIYFADAGLVFTSRPGGG